MQTFFQSVVDSFAQLQQQDTENVSTNRDQPRNNAPAAFSWTKSLAEAASQFGISGLNQQKVAIPVPTPVRTQCAIDAKPLDVWRQRWTDLEQSGDYAPEMIAHAVKRAIRKFHCQLIEDPPTLPPPPSYEFVLDKSRADFAHAIQLEVDCEDNCQPTLPLVRRALLRSIFDQTDAESPEHLIDFWAIYIYQYQRFLDESLMKPQYSPVVEQLEVIKSERKAEEEREKLMRLRVENLKREVEQERAHEGTAETIRPIITSWIKSGEEKLTSLLNNPVQSVAAVSANESRPNMMGGPAVGILPKEQKVNQSRTESGVNGPSNDIELIETYKSDDQNVYRMKDDELDEFEKQLGL